MATDREESIRSAARAYADSMGHGDACDLTLYGACDLTLYGEEYRCDCGYAALRSALAQPAAPSVIVPPDVSRTAQQAYLDGYAARARMELYEAVDDAQGEPK